VHQNLNSGHTGGDNGIKFTFDSMCHLNEAEMGCVKVWMYRYAGNREVFKVVKVFRACSAA